MSPSAVEIGNFINELNAFASIAEDTLKKIEDDKVGNKGLFGIFSEKMLAIRGTALQLHLSDVAKIAGLSEEIALKGAQATNNRQIRKCIGSLWDALTTVKYMLVHHGKGTSEEQGILVARLEDTLRAFGGARPTLSADEIADLLKNR